jgi:hypothetical protein
MHASHLLAAKDWNIRNGLIIRPRMVYSRIVSDILTGKIHEKVVSDARYRGPWAEAARQYYTGALADSMVAPIAAVTPGTTETSIFSISQANKFLPLPYGQNAPSPGQIFRLVCGGLLTTPASGTVVVGVYHGPGSTSTAFGTLLGKSIAFTPTASITAGYWQLEGNLVYRTISEVATTSTAWFGGDFECTGPSGGTLADVGALVMSNAAVPVDTTGTGGAAFFGALNVTVTPSVTGSTWTPEFAYVQSVN